MSPGRRGGPPVEALVRLVEAEGRRVLGEAALAADPARLADGWERRFIADGARLEEAMALYTALGFEVAADPLVGRELPADCTDCRLATLLSFKTLYTRRPQETER